MLERSESEEIDRLFPLYRWARSESHGLRQHFGLELGVPLGEDLADCRKGMDLAYLSFSYVSNTP